MMKHYLILSALFVAALARFRPHSFVPESNYLAPNIHLPREECYSLDSPVIPQLGANCSNPTFSSCRGDTRYHPFPCNCHRYFQCDQGKVCYFWCDPVSLVFNPITELCEYEETSPPGLCQDTTQPTPEPTTSMTTPTTKPTTASTMKPTTTNTTTTTTTTTTTQTTTTPTTPAPTTTTGDGGCWICPECTCEGNGIDSEGFFKPHPDNCHWYYGCEYDENNANCPWTSTGPYDCGDWVFNPDQASCIFPELAPPELCEEQM